MVQSVVRLLSFIIDLYTHTINVVFMYILNFRLFQLYFQAIKYSLDFYSTPMELVFILLFI
jgi:hypothetical protein